MTNPKRDTIFSGVQPSRSAHLGNYLGAIKNWLAYQDGYECFFFVPDLHSITVALDPKELRDATYQVIAFYIACGLDPDKITFFLQSHVNEHAELGWVLNCFSYVGELQRMHQYKDKSQRLGTGGNIGVGILTYPLLMAADILLYKAKYVPVGEDQKQHVELTRDLAIRINNRFEKELFRVPEPMIEKSGARIMDLQEPQKKMSKSSANHNGTLFISDSDKELAKKVKTAVTDSQSLISFEHGSPGVQNLLEIYALLSGCSPQEVESKYVGKQYGHLKVDLADQVVASIAPLREKTNELIKDKSYLDQILAKGAQKARIVARKTLQDLYDTLGFIPRKT